MPVSALGGKPLHHGGLRNDSSRSRTGRLSWGSGETTAPRGPCRPPAAWTLGDEGDQAAESPGDGPESLLSSSRGRSGGSRGRGEHRSTSPTRDSFATSRATQSLCSKHRVLVGGRWTVAAGRWGRQEAARPSLGAGVTVQFESLNYSRFLLF